MQKTMSVFIGRFSPFHLGHEEVLLRALESSGVVLLLIGSAGAARNIKNPFTYGERKAIIDEWAKHIARKHDIGELVIMPLYDHPYNNQKWISEVQSAVLKVKDELTIHPDADVYLTGAERDVSTWYLQAFGNFFKKDFVQEGRVSFENSATDIRNDLFKGGHAWEFKTPEETIWFLDRFIKTEEFKALQDEFSFVKKYKEAWKAAPYAPIFSTVDACVIQSGHVLVVVRDAQPGKGLWALPGGFVEQHETLQDAVVRELVEETSIGLSKAQLYGSITDKEIFDNPGRSLRGRTITTGYLFVLNDTKEHPKTKPQAGEIAKIMWLPIALALGNPSHWYEDHHAILETLYSRIKS